MKKAATFTSLIVLLSFALRPLTAHAQTVSFSISADTVCQDSCITFINTSTGPADSIKWVVYGDTAAIPHTDTITVCYLSAGIDSVRLYVYTAGSADSLTQVVHIKKMPHPRLLRDFVNCGLSVPDIYPSYRWEGYHATSPGTPYVSTNTTHQLVPVPWGVWLWVVVDSNGCMGRSDTAMICFEGVEKISKQAAEVTLYPNPAINELTVKYSGTITTIGITNLLGQTVFSNNYNTKEVVINVADLPKGVYFVKVNGSDVRRFVKE